MPRDSARQDAVDLQMVHVAAWSALVHWQHLWSLMSPSLVEESEYP